MQHTKQETKREEKDNERYEMTTNDDDDDDERGCPSLSVMQLINYVVYDENS